MRRTETYYTDMHWSLFQSFASFIEAQCGNPEVLYRVQLIALERAGFNDVDKNVAALKRGTVVLLSIWLPDVSCQLMVT